MKTTKLLGVSIVFGLLVMTPRAFAQNNNVSELSAAWWQWIVAIPQAASPTVDSTGQNCSVQQNGPAWFLAGTPGGSATRFCTIPAGKKIFFPIITAEWSAAEATANGGCFVDAGPNGNGTDENALRLCAIAQIDHTRIIQARVDGVWLVNSGSLDDSQPPDSLYRQQSPPFTFHAVKKNPFGIPKGFSEAVADGYWILLDSLSPGEHEIYFRGVLPLPEFGFTFETEVTYHLTVQ